MQCFPQTLVLRHRKENLKKCSLKGLESRSDFKFLTYPKDKLPDLSSYVLLALDAPELTEADGSMGLFLLDGTWRYAETMLEWVEGQVQVQKRQLPKHLITAYPRRQDDERGLASIEALYAAYIITGRDPLGMLDDYYWKHAFLAKNKQLR